MPVLIAIEWDPAVREEDFCVCLFSVASTVKVLVFGPVYVNHSGMLSTMYHDMTGLHTFMCMSLYVGIHCNVSSFNMFQKPLSPMGEAC